eukprot:COSAG02_NODE_13266_length_1418_cov_1.141016_1_plen_68_part_00
MRAVAQGGSLNSEPPGQKLAQQRQDARARQGYAQEWLRAVRRVGECSNAWCNRVESDDDEAPQEMYS